MPAVVLAYSTLVHRYKSALGCGPPAPGKSVWDAFPFNQTTFREIAGIDSEETGLSVPPVGRVGERVSRIIRNTWPKKGPLATAFLEHCDEQWRLMRQNNTYTTFDRFVRDVIRSAPGVADFVWCVEQTFSVIGGLYTKVEDAMVDHGCSAAAAWTIAREQAVSAYP